MASRKSSLAWKAAICALSFTAPCDVATAQGAPRRPLFQ